VTSTTRACPAAWTPPFPGAAVVGLNPSGTSVTSGTSGAVRWHLTGGGVFANDDAYTKNGTAITFSPAGTCVEAVGTASNFGCTPVHQNQTASKVDYPGDIAAISPPIPPCTGVATISGGQVHEQVGFENKGSVISGLEHDFAPGVYCIVGLSGMMTLHGATTGNGVTLYLKDTDNFTVKFTGNGGYVSIVAPTSGPYANLAIFSHVTATPCTQNFEFRGNGASANKGTIFLPSACIDWRGTSSGNDMRTQLIGYQVTSNGDASVAINFNPDDQYKIPIPNKLELIK
jgi:hypothetical protein